RVPARCGGVPAEPSLAGAAPERVHLGRLPDLEPLPGLPRVHGRPGRGLRTGALRRARHHRGPAPGLAPGPRPARRPGGGDSGGLAARLAPGGLGGLAAPVRGRRGGASGAPGQPLMTARRVAIWALYSLTLVAVLTIALSTLTRFDFWWYLRAGEMIVDT